MCGLTGSCLYSSRAGRRDHATRRRTRAELARTRTQAINRLHKLLLELVPGGAKRLLTAPQAKSILDGVSLAADDVAGRVRHQIAHDLLTEIAALDHKIKESDKTLRRAVAATGTGLLGLNGIGPVSAARTLGDVLDVARFATRARFASWNGTAPLDASSADQRRHRLSRAGNRRINRALHIMAIVQIRHDTPGRAYFHRRLAGGKTKMEALRALKRRLSDVVYRQLVADAGKASPGGHSGATTTSSAADPTPTVDSSDKSLPGLDPETTRPPDHNLTNEAGDPAEPTNDPAPPRRRHMPKTTPPARTLNHRTTRTPPRRPNV